MLVGVTSMSCQRATAKVACCQRMCKLSAMSCAACTQQVYALLMRVPGIGIAKENNTGEQLGLFLRGLKLQCCQGLSCAVWQSHHRLCSFWLVYCAETYMLCPL